MRKYRNKGIPPRDTSVVLGIEWANGQTAKHTYTADQLVFALRDHPFDVAYFWRIDGKDEEQVEEQAA